MTAVVLAGVAAANPVLKFNALKTEVCSMYGSIIVWPDQSFQPHGPAPQGMRSGRRRGSCAARCPICFRLLTHWLRRAASRAACTAGSSSAIRTAMIAITTSSSIRVKPRRLRIHERDLLEETNKNEKN